MNVGLDLINFKTLYILIYYSTTLVKYISFQILVQLSSFSRKSSNHPSLYFQIILTRQILYVEMIAGN